MVKSFFRDKKYENEEVIELVIKSDEPLFIRVKPSFMVDTQVAFRLQASDGTEVVGNVLLPAFCETVAVPDRFIKPGVLDVTVSEINEDETVTKVWSGPSLFLYSMAYCFGAHDRINDIIEALPKINKFLEEYPELKDVVDRLTTIVFDPLDVGGLGG